MNNKRKVPTTIYNKPVGYCTPVNNHNIGRQQAKQIRKTFVVDKK